MARSLQVAINCSICNKPVDLASKRDVGGKAVHAECYVLREALKLATQPTHQQASARR